MFQCLFYSYGPEQIYPLANRQFAIEAMAHWKFVDLPSYKMVDLSIKNGDLIYPWKMVIFHRFLVGSPEGQPPMAPSGPQGLRNKAWAMKHFGSVQLMFRCGPEWGWPEIHWEKTKGKNVGISWDFTKITCGLVKYHTHIYIYIIFLLGKLYEIKLTFSNLAIMRCTG